MNYYADMPYGKKIVSLHRALRVACGKPPLPPTYQHVEGWSIALNRWAFLEMGEMTEADMPLLVKELRRRNEYEGATFGINPDRILRNLGPANDTALDVLYELRKKKQLRQARPAPVAPVAPAAPPPQDERVDPAEFSRQMDELRRKFGYKPKEDQP